MPEPADPAPQQQPKKRVLRRLRFSLRTLVAFVLLVGSAGGLWWRWQPWCYAYTLGDNSYRIFGAICSPDNGTIVTLSGDGASRVWDAQSGQERFVLNEGGNFIPCIKFSADGH